MKYDKTRFMFDTDDGNGPPTGVEGADSHIDTAAAAVSAVSASPTIDHKALAKEFGSVLADQFKQRDASQPKAPPTPEQIAEARKSLKFWEPDDTFIKDFGNLETQKQAFIRMRDGLTEQNAMVFQAMLAQEREAWNARFQPVQSLIEQRNNAEQIERFHKAYPIFSNPKLESLRNSVGNQLLASGAFNGKSEAESFDILAKGMESVAQVTNPDFKLSEGGGNSSASSSGRPRSNGITPAPAGSGGGGSGNGAGNEGQGGKVPRAVSFLPKIRG